MIVEKAWEVLTFVRAEGPRTSVTKSYLHLVSLLSPPNATDEYVLNGVRVDADLGHAFLRHPESAVARRFYEQYPVQLLHKHAEPGDVVVDVGAGLGVTAVHAAWCVGERGRVYGFEASERCAEAARSTVSRNRTSAPVTIVQGTIGAEANVRFGEADASEAVDPRELPHCDVLMLDCEGAELEILRQIEQAPRVVIAETHAQFDAPAHEVIQTLKSNGYRITDLYDHYHDDLANLAAIKRPER